MHRNSSLGRALQTLYDICIYMQQAALNETAAPGPSTWFSVTGYLLAKDFPMGRLSAADLGIRHFCPCDHNPQGCPSSIPHLQPGKSGCLLQRGKSAGVSLCMPSKVEYLMHQNCHCQFWGPSVNATGHPMSMPLAPGRMKALPNSYMCGAGDRRNVAMSTPRQ